VRPLRPLGPPLKGTSCDDGVRGLKIEEGEQSLRRTMTFASRIAAQAGGGDPRAGYRARAVVGELPVL
jgi:hypothetical protein